MVAVASPVLIYSHLSIDQTGVCTSSLDIVNIVYIGSCEISCKLFQSNNSLGVVLVIVGTNTSSDHNSNIM